MKAIFFIFFPLLLNGCYSFEQGYGQLRLLLKQQPIDDVIANNSETPDRLEKLKIVPSVLEYAKRELALTPGKSYQKYIALNSSSVTWIVQAAEKRELKLKTWWFPFIGEQPYLGFFSREKALIEKQNLVEQNLDTIVGGISAFSLLGYLPDPLYSSMLDHSSMAQFIETLIHESVHRTFYLPNYYSFNENLADFIAKKATIQFLEAHPELKLNVVNYIKDYQKNLKAQKKFQEYLIKVKIDLANFYEDSKNNPQFKNEELFLAERQRKLNKIATDYKSFMNGIELGTYYQHAFIKDKINNALILSYSVYESKQEIIESAYILANSDLKQLLKNLEICLAKVPEDEQALWTAVAGCNPSDSV